jgi:hypothetical protein
MLLQLDHGQSQIGQVSRHSRSNDDVAHFSPLARCADTVPQYPIKDIITHRGEAGIIAGGNYLQTFAPRLADAARKRSSRVAGIKLLPGQLVLCAKYWPHGANLTRRAEWF